MSVFTWKKFIVILALVTLVSSTFAQTASDRVSAITSALSRGEFDKALQVIEPALQGTPKNPQLWMLQGLAYSGKGDRKAALASYQKAIKIAPDYLPALEGAAQVEYDAGSPSAIPLLQHVLRLRPNDSTSHAMLAVLAYKKHDCATAVQHFAQSGSLLNSQPGALQEYGACLMELRQTDKAIPVFQQILVAHPDDPRARRSLAAVQLAAEQPEAALVTLQRLLAGDPDVSAMQLAAAAYEANKDTPNAVKMLHDAIVKDPRNAAQGLAAVQENDLDDALAHVQEKLAGKPNDPILFYLEADVLTQKGFDPGSPEFKTAMRAAKKAVALRPTLGPARGVLAKLYLQSGLYSEAVAQCRKALESDPKDQAALYHLIQALRKSGKNSEIPDLLKRLALLRQEATKEEREQYRYKLVEADARQ